jgi:hypothetical protein
MVFGFVLALGVDVAPLSALVADPVCQKRVAWTEAVVLDVGNARVLVVELVCIMEGMHEVLYVGDFGVAVPDECADTLLLVCEGSLSLVFGCCNALRSDITYMVWVMSVHGRVTVNADADAGVCEGRGRVERIDGGIESGLGYLTVEGISDARPGGQRLGHRRQALMDDILMRKEPTHKVSAL